MRLQLNSFDSFQVPRGYQFINKPLSHWLPCQVNIALVSLRKFKQESFTDVRQRYQLTNNESLMEVLLCLELADVPHWLIGEHVVRDAHKPIFVVLVGVKIFESGLLQLREKDSEDGLGEPSQAVVLELLAGDVFALQFVETLVRLRNSCIDSQEHRYQVRFLLEIVLRPFDNLVETRRIACLPQQGAQKLLRPMFRGCVFTSEKV